MQRALRLGRFCTVLLGIAFVAGLTPTLFNIVVDPFEHGSIVDLDIEKRRISAKAHTPLWKVLHYPNEGADVVVLGDSRSGALRNKYWHELGLSDAFNHAYGGATIPEIYNTFLEVRKDPRLRTLVIGVPLRCFDVDHRRGLNRVPEALALRDAPLDYYTSWFVSRISWRLIENQYDAELQALGSLIPEFVSKAEALETSEPESMPIETLLLPEACYGCELPDIGGRAVFRPANKGPNLGLGRGLGQWAAYWPLIESSRELPKKFERQVQTNARSDWRSFSISEVYWSYLVEIAEWSEANGVDLIFVIPPTISEMQARIGDFGHAETNHQFRTRLAELAPVVDFDFDNAMTRELANFTDAYHFKGPIARNIVGEITQLFSENSDSLALARKRRGEVICPVREEEISQSFTDGIVTMNEGSACRIWRWNNG